MRTRRSWTSAGLLASAVTVGPPAAVGAEREQTDGVYGRFDGDLDLGVALGGELEKDAARAAARFSAHYFCTAGVYASYRDALSRDDPDARLVSFGVDLRPLFIPRWSLGWENGPALLDLVLDSASLSLGAYFGSAAPETHAPRGLELGLGFGVPLSARASGPWLGARGLGRWPEPMLGGHELSALATLGWQWMVHGPWL
ncbi:MAG: hypothetical protein JW940_23760 [Polyangiaceae bacterium]|nr:hypothetical protein [Polyangiaceae bacterium]